MTMVDMQTSLGTNVTIDLPNGRYLLRPKAKASSFPGFQSDDRKLPVLLFSSAFDDVTEESIALKLQYFQTTDDVFSSDFLSTTIIIQSKATSQTETLKVVRLSNLQVPATWSVQKILALPLFADGSVLPSGPYFLYEGHICEAWKLYADELSSFQTTVVPDLNDPYKFHILDSVSSDGYWKVVAVPSRLYSQPSASLPLAGSRIAVKDLFHLSGIKSALNVRAFLELYGPDTYTAEYVRKLIDLGAVIVGKTKMTAFAGGERAPEFWIDFHCPFNPRADGYQTPSGSTSGGGACLAGYKWLDFSVGSDTYGSIRWPAAANGLYGLRCTVDKAASMDGIYGQVRSFDTLGLLSRDLSQFHGMAKASLNSTISNNLKYPKRILCPTDWSANHSSFHIAVIDKLASALENFLGVSRTSISLAETWQKNPPPQAGGKSFQEFFHKTGYNVFYYDAYHEWDQFRKEYQQSFGKTPYVGPQVTYLWGLGAGISAAERTEAMHELEIFRNWVEKHVFPTNLNSDSPAILVLPVLSTEPDYRDVLSGPFQARFGVDEISFGSWLGVPELVLPIEQISYKSKITDRPEFLPVSVSILGAKGSDLMLINLALATLHQAGLPSSLETGRYVFANVGN